MQAEEILIEQLKKTTLEEENLTSSSLRPGKRSRLYRTSGAVGDRRRRGAAASESEVTSARRDLRDNSRARGDPLAGAGRC